MTAVYLIGDSFSDPTYAGDQEGVSWTHRLMAAYDVTPYAYRGWSNLDIWSKISIVPDNGLKIINLSHPTRFPKESKLASDLSRRYVSDPTIMNMKAAEKIVSSHTNSSFIWSPFPGYDHLSAVKYLPFEQENELYNLSIARQNVGNHFTQKGNDLLFDIVDRWLQEKLSGTS